MLQYKKAANVHVREALNGGHSFKCWKNVVEWLIFCRSSNQLIDLTVSALMMFESFDVHPTIQSLSWEQVPQLWLWSEDLEANGAGNLAGDSYLDRPEVWLWIWDRPSPRALCSSHEQLRQSVKCILNWPALILCWCTPKPKCWLYQNKEIANCMKPLLGGFISPPYYSFLHPNEHRKRSL